jgi:Fe2+ transport system protein B
MKKGILPGADFVWLSLISLFMVLNPISGRPFMLMFSFYLIGMTAVTIFGITLDKRLRHEKISLHMVLDFPYMIPICAALVMAVVTG